MATENQAKEALELIFKRLEKEGKGISFSAQEKETIIEKVLENLKENNVLDKLDLSNQQHLKVLAIGIKTEYVALQNPNMPELSDPDKKFKYAGLIENKKMEHQDDIKNDLKLQLKNLFAALDKLYPRPTGRDLEKEAEETAEILAQKYNKNDHEKEDLANTKNVTNTFASILDDLVSLTLRSTFGKDTRYPDKVSNNDIGGIMIDIGAYANYSPPTEQSLSGQEKRAEVEDPLAADYNAAKGTTLLDDLMNGLEEELENLGVLKEDAEETNRHSNWPPRNVPRGTSS